MSRYFERFVSKSDICSQTHRQFITSAHWNSPSSGAPIVKHNPIQSIYQRCISMFMWLQLIFVFLFIFIIIFLALSRNFRGVSHEFRNNCKSLSIGPSMILAASSFRIRGQYPHTTEQTVINNAVWFYFQVEKWLSLSICLTQLLFWLSMQLFCL